MEIVWCNSERSVGLAIVESSFEDETSDNNGSCDKVGSVHDVSEWSVERVLGWLGVEVSSSSGGKISIDGDRSMVELVKKERGKSLNIWNLDKEFNIFCSQKLIWQEIQRRLGIWS